MDDADDPPEQTAPSTESHSITAVLNDALREFASANAEAANLLFGCAADEKLESHMTDGSIRELADQLIATCAESTNAD